MPNNFVIQSHTGPYSVEFVERLIEDHSSMMSKNTHFIVDSNIANLYGAPLSDIISHPNAIGIEATEDNKDLERVIPIIRTLLSNSIRRDHVLVAVGGGIIQDITCFIASTLLRGINWKFVPTTLLAQADSCIGSKSSINLGSVKNILGTFNPPREVLICTGFLDTLRQRDLCSGVGEILKVHAIDGAASFDQVAGDYANLLTDRFKLLEYVRRALQIKQRYIEVDEFDRGVRNIFNYGHSFGHAIESATNFLVPHGIAVSIGMDMANFVAAEPGLLPNFHYQRMHDVLRMNYAAYCPTDISIKRVFDALLKDKKNVGSEIVLILPIGQDAKIERTAVSSDEVFRRQCAAFLDGLKP